MNGARGLQLDLSNPIKTNIGESKAAEMYKASEGSAMKYYNQAQPNIPMPGKTVGGALTSGLAGAGAGAATGAAMGAGLGPYGAAAGAVIGAAGYYFS